MPYKAEKAGHIPPEKDKRVKLTDEQREEIRELYKLPDWSQRRLAGEFKVSRRLIQFIVDPEKLAAAKQAYSERRKDGRYYDKDAHTKAIREHRHHKHQLYLDGQLEGQESVMNETICPRHGGAWGTDETCPNCTDQNGRPLLAPLYELGNEANWRLCSDQLRAAGVSEKDLEKFAFRFGYHNQEGTHAGRAIESAAEDCGYEVRWDHQKEEERNDHKS